MLSVPEQPFAQKDVRVCVVEGPPRQARQSVVNHAPGVDGPFRGQDIGEEIEDPVHHRHSELARRPYCDPWRVKRVRTNHDSGGQRWTTQSGTQLKRVRSVELPPQPRSREPAPGRSVLLVRNGESLLRMQACFSQGADERRPERT
jgi:hypothetical protein